TTDERRKAGDPRKSIEERYGSREDYLDRFTHALDELIAQRWVLPEDRTALLIRGRQEWEEATRQ
ncbi:MAG TPA: alpha/beta hydrolase domain-containing protein, partial [Steroidobacteraceae bacterium]|nr:alpha/beta hydrolase domain-containing protein [Steroidobacteraceae bacterium]